MICLAVYFPEGAVTNANQGSMDIWSSLALSFFLEALYKGSSLFNARPFKILALDTERDPGNVGEGVYEVKDRELFVIEEHGEIAGIITEAWHEMKKRLGQK